jgi:signal transduction histidine kinase
MLQLNLSPESAMHREAAPECGADTMSRIKMHRSPQFPLQILCLAGSLTGIATIFWLMEQALAHQTQAPVLPELHMMMSANLIALAVCSIGMVFTRKPGQTRLALVLKFVLLEFYLTATFADNNAELLLVLPLLLEIATYEAFVVNFLMCGGAIVLFFLIRLANLQLVSQLLDYDPLKLRFADTQSLLPDIGYLMFICLFALTACGMAFFRGRLLDSEKHKRQLRQGVAKLTEANLNYQNAASDAGARSREAERLRITRELHDIIGYTFTSNIMMMEAAISILYSDPGKVSQLIDEARGNTQGSLERIRKALYDLRGIKEDAPSLKARVAQLANIFNMATHVQVSLDFGNMTQCRDGASAEFFYYFVQQAITNAYIHGQATRIEVAFNETGDSLLAMVNDDGKGKASLTEGIGISGMRERLAELDGTLLINQLDPGLQLVSEIPKRHEE